MSHADKAIRQDAGATPRIVLFDLGEVLASPRDLYDHLGAAVGAPGDDLALAYWRHRDEYDLGATSHRYWTAVLDDLAISPAPDAVERLTRIDTDAWTTVRHDAVALLRRLHAAGVRIGILSNATHEMASQARRTTWARYVTDWFFSAGLGLSKPDPALYVHVTRELGVDSGSILFIDDREINVRAARSAGWRAEVWISGDKTTQLLEHLRLL